MQAHRRLSLALLGLLLVVAFALSASRSTAQRIGTENDLDAAYAVIGELNAWRLENGLTPVRINETLMELAFFHADYVRTLGDNIPDGSAIHIGRSGDKITDRARWEPFNWPHYRLFEQIQVGEIAAVNSLDSAVAFWRSSRPHRETVTNPAYREVGAAALAHPFGYLYIVVFGSRPGVLPVLAHPVEDRLYLTQDESLYAHPDAGMVEPKVIRLFDADGLPLGDWQPYAPVIDLPPDAGEVVYVLLQNSDQQTLNRVDRRRDIIALPGFAPAPQVVVVGSPGDPTPTPLPTATPEPVATLTLLYTPRSLTIINTSGGPLDIFPYSFGTDDFALSVTWWLQVADFPAGQFPNDHCLQVWTSEATSAPRPPSACRVRRAGRGNLPPEQDFWAEGTFNIYRDGRVVAVCEADAGRCEVMDD